MKATTKTTVCTYYVYTLYSYIGINVLPQHTHTHTHTIFFPSFLYLSHFFFMHMYIVFKMFILIFFPYMFYQTKQSVLVNLVTYVYIGYKISYMHIHKEGIYVDFYKSLYDESIHIRTHTHIHRHLCRL